MQAVLAQTPRDSFGEMGQRGFEPLGIFGVFIECVFMAYGFRIAPLTYLRVKPAPRIEPVLLARERESPLAEAPFEDFFVHCGEVANTPDTERVKILLHRLSDAGHFAYRKRSKETRFHSGQNPENAVGLRLIG